MADKPRTLEYTPTWAVALVVTVFFILGFIIIYAFEFIEKILHRTGRKPLVQTLDKIKEELMLLGCISLLLTVFQYDVEKICIKSTSMDNWNPCPPTDKYSKKEYSPSPAPSTRRRILNLMNGSADIHGRMLEDAYKGICKEGYNSVVSTKVLHNLHTYIFVLACIHVVFSLSILLFATLKMRGWKKWEEEAQTANPDHIRDVSQQLAVERNRSFVRHHTADPLSRNIYLVWIVCFLRQFGHSVTRSDYLSLRQGFITTHNLQSNFNFHAYLKRSLADDYPKIVGLTPLLCAIVVLIMLFNVHGTNLYFWASFVPGVLILLVGAKMQHVIATLALDNAGISHHGRFKGGTVRLRDDLFWFNRPGIILFLIQYTLFQTSFETATFVGIYWSNGFSSCFLNGKGFIIVRVIIALLSMILCAWSTFPSYALVVQMGSHYKGAIFHENVQHRLKKWRKDAKKRVKVGTDSENNSTHGREVTFDDESTIDGTVHARTIDPEDDIAYNTQYHAGQREGEDTFGDSGRFSRAWYQLDDLPGRTGSERYTRSNSAPVRNVPVPERPLLPHVHPSHLEQVPEIDVPAHRHLR